MGFELEGKQDDIKAELNAEQIKEDSFEWWESLTDKQKYEHLKVYAESEERILELYCKEKNIKVL